MHRNTYSVVHRNEDGHRVAPIRLFDDRETARRFQRVYEENANIALMDTVTLEPAEVLYEVPEFSVWWVVVAKRIAHGAPGAAYEGPFRRVLWADQSHPHGLSTTPEIHTHFDHHPNGNVIVVWCRISRDEAQKKAHQVVGMTWGAAVADCMTNRRGDLLRDITEGGEFMFGEDKK
jgi:hypothetical protein